MQVRKPYPLLTLIACTLLFGAMPAPSFAGMHPSYTKHIDVDTVPFYPDGTYDETIPHPNEYMQHPIGKWPLRYHELERYILKVAELSDRVVVEKHYQSHEGRQLYNVFLSAPENINRLDAIRETMEALADPSISPARRDSLAAAAVPIAWLGYSIHGDEISGVDAAAMMIYQLAAGTDQRTLDLINNLVIIIDPSENPDGRERYLSMLQTYKSHVPNYDRFSQQHSGVWPYGRGNHYLFDLNRDWFVVSQPETKGRVETIKKWHPLLVVDAHEMGSNATFLFTPPREPVNYNTPETVRKWWNVFAGDQAAAFDRRQWPYYVGEWHEQWFPGYGSAWPTFWGSVGILYEQAGVDGEFVKQQDNYLLTYHEAINHQFTGSLANLFTLHDNREAILEDWLDTRQSIVSEGRQSNLRFVVVPDGDELKLNRFIDALTRQGIVIERATESFTASQVTDRYGEISSRKEYSEGTLIISTAQPTGRLARAILELDPHLKLEFLEEERRELEKEGGTRMYEVSSWSMLLAMDLDAYETRGSYSVTTEPVTGPTESEGRLSNPTARYGFIVPYEGERTYRTLARLYDEPVTIHASEKPFAIGGRQYEAGSLVLRRRGNPDDLPEILERIATEEGVEIIGVQSGQSSRGSYLGAPTFRVLQRPHVAVLTGNPLDYTSFGALWHTIDRELELPHSLISINGLSWRGDLSAYNVLVVPDVWGGSFGSQLGRSGAKILKEFVENGGTLVLVGSAAVWAADSSSNFSKVRLYRQNLEKLDEYAVAVEREREALDPTVDTMALYYPDRVDDEPDGETAEDAGLKNIDEEYDRWRRRFMPRGVHLRAQLDTDHWLAFGMKDDVPVLLYTNHAFLAREPVSTVGRFADSDNVRLSGLLWPEARHRWANTAYLTRESSGRGQIIMFLGEPNTRAYYWGTRKLFVNAILYGPGMGSSFDGPYSQQ